MSFIFSENMVKKVERKGFSVKALDWLLMATNEKGKLYFEKYYKGGWRCLVTSHEHPAPYFNFIISEYTRFDDALKYGILSLNAGKVINP